MVLFFCFVLFCFVCFLSAGGILADERQLGKTTEIIGLTLANPSTKKLEGPPAFSIEQLNSLPLVDLLFPTNATLGMERMRGEGGRDRRESTK
jgi:hypothetical protein